MSWKSEKLWRKSRRSYPNWIFSGSQAWTSKSKHWSKRSMPYGKIRAPATAKLESWKAFCGFWNMKIARPLSTISGKKDAIQEGYDAQYQETTGLPRYRQELARLKKLLWWLKILGISALGQKRSAPIAREAVPAQACVCAAIPTVPFSHRSAG